MNTDKIFAEAIANEYAPKDTSKVVALRKLDRKAKNPANIFAYSFGVLMTLVLGLGMCLSMQVIGRGGVLMTGIGILLGILGMVGVGLNYLIYKKLLRSGKEKYAFEIMQLAREISEAAENTTAPSRRGNSWASTVGGCSPTAIRWSCCPSSRIILTALFSSSAGPAM